MATSGILYTVLLLLLVGQITAQGYCPAVNPKCTCKFDDHDIVSSIVCSGLGQLDPSVPLINASDQIIPTVRIEKSTIYTLPSRLFKGSKIRNLLLNDIGLSVIEPYALEGLEPYLESLEVKGGAFVVLPNYFLFNFTSLKTLALDGNKLDLVKANWFMHLPGLTYLSMSGNNIRDVEKGSFDLIPNLKVLYLTRNKLTYVPANLFSSLSALSDLSLGNNNISVLPATLFNRLTNLKSLALGRNEIEVIPDRLFQDNQNLEMLYFSTNKIREIGPTKLPTGNKLKVLVLSNNNISVLHDSVFNHVNSLEILSLDNNKIDMLPDLAFESLRHLRKLHLQDNELAELPSNILVGLLQLEELNLQHNKIRVLTYGVFDPLGRLLHLDVSRNLLKEVHFGPFDALRKLMSLDLSRNKLSMIQANWFRKAESLQKLSLNHNVIRFIEDKSFSKIAALEVLYLDYNYIQELRHNMFIANKELRVLSLSHNPLKIVPVGSLGVVPKLQKLYLNYTCLTDLPNGFFTNLSHVEELYLDHSPVGVIRSYSFSGLRGLHTLILGHHNITTIEARPFIHVSNVTNLAADNMGLVTNDLANILVDLSKVTRISLKHNAIEEIQQGTFSYNVNLEELSLAGNPLLCNCPLAWLREFLPLVDLESTLCKDPSSMEASLAACFTLPAKCPPVSPLGSIQGRCQAAPPVQAQDDMLLDYSHCIVPPEPTTPAPTTVSTTAATTISPAVITVVANQTHVIVTWDRNPNPNVVGYRIRYRQFATNEFKNGPVLGVNETMFIITDLESGLNYRVCVDLKFPSGYYRNEAGCKEIGINLPSTIPVTGATEVPTEPNSEKVKDGGTLIPIVGASAGAFIIIFCIIVIIVVCLRKTKTRFAENAKKKQEQDQMVKDKMGAWVNNFNFDGNVNETMGEQMMLDYDLFSGNNATVSKARHAQMLKEANGNIPSEIVVGDGQEDMTLPAPDIVDENHIAPPKSDYPDLTPSNDDVLRDDYPGDVSGSDPGYGESETGYNGSDSTHGDSVRYENVLY